MSSVDRPEWLTDAPAHDFPIQLSELTMAFVDAESVDELEPARDSASAVSWGTIVAGAVAAAALSLIHES